MKKVLTIILTLGLLISAVGLCACVKNENEQGLAFYLQDDGTYSVGIGYAEELSKIVIPATYNGKAVTKIKENFANGSQQLKEITIPDSVKTIGSDAFYYCRSLTKVAIGDSVKEIGRNAFCDCSSLTSITIPESVKEIGSSAFSYCSSLTSITIPNSVEEIGDGAFSACYKLVEVINKSSLNITKRSSDNGCVGVYALNIKTSGTSDIVNKDNYLFYTYDSVNYLLGYVGGETKLIIPNDYNGNSYKIYQFAFYKCSSLTSITIPNNVNGIGRNAFGACSSLTSITIPESVTSIGDDAFYNCSSLTEVTIGDSVTSIGKSAFYNCSSLTSVTFSDSSNWYRIGNYTNWEYKMGGTLTDLSNPSTNATYFTSYNYYCDYYWYKLDN